MASLAGHIDKDCEFILELIVTMYERVIDKIESCSYDPMGRGHRLTPGVKPAIMSEVAHRTGFRLVGPAPGKARFKGQTA